MIKFSNNISVLLQNPAIEAFYCITVGSYRTTSFYSNITLSNGEVFESDGRLVSVDTPRISTVVDREIFKIVLTDADYVLGAQFQSGLVGANFEVRILLINPVNNSPYTNLADTILAYKGIVDNIAYSLQTSGVGETALAISGSSPMNDLDLTRNFYTSREYIKTKYPDDTCFDQIYEGSGPVNLKWGKG
jgi:hypothetical protein